MSRYWKETDKIGEANADLSRWGDVGDSGVYLFGPTEGLLVRGSRQQAVERMRRITSDWAESGYWVSILSAEDANSLLGVALGEQETP